MRQCEHFSIEELVPEIVYQDRGLKAWALLDPRLIEAQDILRRRYGPTFVNTWALSPALRQAYGLRTASGIRLATMAEFRIYSQHSFGRATDSLFQDTTAEEVRADLVAKPGIFPFPITLEDGVSWLHLDVRNASDPVTLFQ